MRNTRSNAMTKRNRAQKFAVGIAIVALLAIIFGTVFAGTLSGAFGIENLQIEKGEISGNVADAVGHDGNPVLTAGTYSNITNGTSKGNGDLWHGSGNGDETTVTVTFSSAMKVLIAKGLVSVSFTGNYGQSGGSDEIRFGIRENRGSSKTIVATLKSGAIAYQSSDGGWNSLSKDAAVSWSTSSIKLNAATTELELYCESEDSGLFSTIDSGVYNVNITVSVTSSGAFTGSGTSSSPFQLASRADFDVLSALCQVLGTSYDTTGKYYKVQPSGTTIDFGSTEFIPIGGVNPNGTSNYNVPFKGILNGNSKTLSNIKVSRDGSYNGLFGVTSGTTISNLTISNPAISGSGTSRGAFIGRSDGTTTLTNCTVSNGSVTATYQAGGLVGYSSGAITFTSCKNQGTNIQTTSNPSSGDSVAQTRAGGFLGSGAKQITISGTSSNSGAVASSAGQDKGGVGGLIGYSAENVSISGTVTNSGTIGTAENKSMCTGGIVGWIVGSLDCTATITNSGTIYGSSAVGGCFGLVASGNISKCKNTGDVYALGAAQTFQPLTDAGAYAGGIVGHFRGTAISNCYNEGKITTSSGYPFSNVVGGIAGYSSGTITYCYAKGNVEGSNYVGGIVGYRANTISYCYFDGTIKSYWDNAGAALGYLTGNDGNSTNTNIQNCFILQNVSFDKSSASSTTCKANQDNKVKIGSNITVYGATKNTSWGYISNWENITSYNVVGIRVSASIANTEYLQLYSPTEFIQGKDEMKNGGNASNANVPFTPWAYFTAERTTDIDVRIENIALSNNTVTYNGASTTDPSATLSNVRSGIYNFKWYFSGTADDGTTCNVAGDANALNAPNHAGAYTSRVDVLIGDIIVGRYNFTYTVNKKELTLTPLWSGTPSSYIYNSVHQGIKSLTVGGVVSPDSLTDIVDVQATNGITISGTYSFENAINVGNYNVIVNLTGENIAKNYKLPNTSSWNWTINKYTITFTPTWTNYTDKSGGNTGNVYTYNGQHQGVSALQFSLAANDYSKIEQILSVSNGTMSVVGATGANNYIYTIGNAINYNSNAYSIQVSLQTTDLAKNYKFATKTTSLPRQETVTENTATYNWNIIQRELILNPTWYNNAENTTYTYNGNAQGIASLSIPNIVSGENFDDIVSVSATNMTVSGQYTFSQSINVGTYGISITKVSSASNYSMPTKTSWNYTIGKRDIQVILSWTDTKTEDGVVKYVYNTNAQGVKEIIFSWYIDTGEDMRNILSIFDNNCDIDSSLSSSTEFYISPTQTKNVGNYLFSVQINQSLKNEFGEDEETLFRQNYQLRFYKNENGTETAIDDLVIDNTVNKSTINDERTFATFEWTISPKTINIGSRQDNGNGFQYGGTVANNGNANSHGHPLSRYEHYFPTDASVYKTPAFVYQGEGYALGNFKVYDLEELTLVGSGTESGLASKKFKAEFAFITLNADGSMPSNLDWKPLAEIGNISLEDKNSAPQIIALRFESLDGNYQFDTNNDNKNRTIYYTLLISDFGVLADKERDDTWGSKDNPYVINTVEHMVRLSHIVNGADSWDSIRNNGSTVGFATDNHYTDAYFVVTADIDLSKTQNMMPIGGHNMDGAENIDHYFSGTFGGVHLVGGRVPYVADEKGIDQIQYDVHKSPTLATPTEIFTISLHGNMATSSYVGLFGIIKGARIAGLHIQYAVKHDAGFVPQNYRGGVVGRAEGRSVSCGEVGDGNTNIVYSVIENVSVQAYAETNQFVGKDYTGGLIGYAINTQILQYYIDGEGNEQPFTRFVNGAIKGENYVGGIVGYWLINDSEQIGGNERPLAHSANNFYVEGKAFVGSHVGYADASAVKGKLVITPWTTPQASESGVSYSTTVVGKEFFGGLYGAFIGNGYKKNSLQNDADETTLVLNPSYVNGFNIYAASGSTANVVGGLAGYISNVGVKIVKDGGIQMFHFTSKNNTQNMLAGANFFGYFFGIIGENATLENPTDFTDGNIHNIGVSEDHGISGGSFVGGIAGYMSAGAGVYYGSSGTLFGNKIAIVIAGMGSNSIEGTGDYVGGVFGAIGKIGKPDDSVVSTYVNRLSLDRAKTILQNTMSYDSTTLTFGPQTYDFGDSTAQPIGRVANLGDVKGKNYVGGIVGAVFSKARLDFKNPVYTSRDGMGNNLNTPYLNDTGSTGKIEYFNHTRIYNGHQANGTNNYIRITGTDYVGGIAGKLFGEYHELKYIMSRAYIIGSSYVGGIVGEMENGSIENSASVLPLNNPDGTITSSANCYQGTSKVGGIVGSLKNGTVKNSITTGMKFTGYAATKADVGGIAGEKGQNASVVASWAIYAAESATYSTVPANDIGKFVVLDKSTAEDFVIPKYVDIACMIGLYNFDIQYNHVAVHDTSQVQPDYLTFAAKVPKTGNKQIVFYDGSGTDTQTNNTFAYFVSQNDDLSLRFGAFGANEQDSMIITKTDVVFKNIAPYSGGANTDAGKENAAKGYRAPSASDRYMATVGTAVYGNSQNNISELGASIKFNGKVTSTSGNWQVVGHYSNTFTLGGDTPYIIASQKDWDEFAYSVYSGENNYQGQTVRLMTDSVVINHNGGSHNGKDFSRNGGYNFAGDISIGANSTLTDAEKSKTFQGTFDGNGYSIGFSYSGGGARISAFPNAGGSTVFRNLTIGTTADKTLAGTGGDGNWDLAGFVGKPFGAITFTNCVNNVDVTGYRLCAGFTGYSSQETPITMVSCVNNGDITTKQNIAESDWNKPLNQNIGTQKNYPYGTGGLIARTTASITLESCINTGTITSNAVKVGGLIGRVTNAGGGKSELKVLNCANTGNIYSYGLNPHTSSDKEKSGNVMAESGGLIGEADRYVEATITSSYNTGNVRAYGSIIGGLVGILGTVPDTKKPHSSVANYSSAITNSYNTGAITAGYKSFGGTIMMGTSGYNFNGSDAGGLVGNAVKVTISHSYNTGNVTAYGGIGYRTTWQNRIGGILGEATNDNGGCKIVIHHCYNIGEIAALESTDGDTRYGATIVGYMEKEESNSSSSKVYVYDSYAVIGRTYKYVDGSKKTDYQGGTAGWIGFNDGVGSSKKNCVRTGTMLDNVSQLTTVMKSGGTVAPIHGTSTTGVYGSFDNTNWTFIPGCLPQLKVFALDTPNGLSMDSVGFGKNQYGEYNTTATKAGNDEYPYIIRDGIDLLGLSRLSQAEDTFKGKYIEFANSTNNIFGASAKIDMLTYKYSTSSATTATRTGKSYHLYSMGGAMTEFATWNASNYYYTETGERAASSSYKTIEALHGVYNFYPIGIDADFAGTISGKQEASEKTTIDNLNVRAPLGSSYHFAALIGEATGANISYINTRGTAICTDAYSAAGGIAGRVGANTVIDNCSSNVIVKGYSYAGGIVGYTNGNNVKITNCSVSAVTTSTPARITANQNNIGGIVGYIGGSSATVLVDNCTVNARILTTNDADATVKYNIGGIVGGISNNTITNISNCNVGKSSEVRLIGVYMLGGIVGHTTQNTRIENCEVGNNTNIYFNNGYNASITKGGTTVYVGNSIGGITGIADNNVTFAGKIGFTGKIQIVNTNNAVRNIGGIVGYMSSGSTFEEGTVVNVGGQIDLNSSSTIENIGGVAGYTEGVTFSGNFTVAPIISLTSGKGTNVGGFIGLNTGATAILATGTTINISGNISGATAVGGFIGKNDANADFNIAPDSFNGRPYITYSVTIDINGNITGTGDNVGGLVGLNASGEGKISVQKGTITIGGTVKGQNNVGGIVGNNSKTLELGGSSCTRKDERAGTTKDALEITQQGKITGINNVGGLIGLLSNGNIISGELSNSGAVEGCIAVGGIIGKFQDGTVSGNFTNTGSVKGVANGNTVSASIGGSIGEMDEGAKIDGARKSTKFVNGTENATTSADALTAADSASATVEGVNCVGGSIGAMLGTIVGSGELKVQFENHAQVTGANYVGGSIGLLVGTVDYAVFVNDGKMGLTGNAVCSLGGSIGFVGVPNDATLGVGHRAISISNSHFEFDGQIDTTGSSSTTDTGTNAGIGGVIGVIKDGASEIVEKFENNTFYVSGNVNAGNLNNVGGVVGLIAANNIKISNMLAYRTEVKGYANVGGIVGATIASGTVIDNAFNVEGNVVGTAKGEGVVLQVGGIIGLAQDDTNASTSYWVKGFNNADLEKADINDLGAFLGKYGNITVDEKLLRTSTSSPTLYLDEAILANPALEQTTQEQEQKETDDDGNEIIVGYITTRTATVSVVLARGTQSTTVTLKRVITTTVSTFEGTTKTETQYTYSVGGNDIVINTEDSEDGTSNDTWNAILDACGYGYKISNEMYVFENSAGDTYTTGKANTGWYFAYANDVKITEGENDVDAINTVHNTDANLQYWKHIANAYTADELAGAGEELLDSAIIKDGAAVAMGHVYATAKKGNNGYYLYVATSNKDVLPTITADNDDAPSLFYIDVFANSKDAQAGNIAIYYKLLEIATSIKYNGYDRHVPVKNNDLQYGERSGYYYTVENGGEAETQRFKNVGTYGGSVAVYYKTATATYEFGGVATTEWKIVAKEITVVNSSLNGTYGGANNVTTITADGIAQPDAENFVFVVTIDGVEYKLKPVASGAFEVYDVEANEWKSSIEYNAGKNITFESFNIEESKSYSKNDKSYSVYGASGAKWQKAVLKIRFSKAKRYELGFGYDGQFGDETSTQKNYTLKSTVSSVNVKPKLLNISIDSNRASAVYDGKEHNTSWMITGWENNEKLSTSYEGKTYEQLFGITAYYAEANSTNYTSTSKVAISYNSNANEVYMQKAKDAGSYTLHFGENVKKSTNTYTVGNYYFKVDTSTAADRKGLDNNKQAQPFIIGVTKIVVTKSDSPSNHVYDGNPGKITFTFSVEDMSGKKLDIADYIDIINGYYNATVDKGSPTPTFNVSKKNNNEASVTFDTGVNAETYTATLTLKNNIDATQKANCLPYDNGKDIKQSHTISKRKLSLTFNMMSGEPYTYDTQHHGLNSVSVNSASGNVGLISGDTVTLNLSVTNGKGWNTSKNGYTPGGALGIITSDAGEYIATVTSLGSNATSNKNRNYELSGTTSCTWTINKKDLTMSVASGSAVYDGTEHFPTVSLEGLSGNNYGADTITFGYKIKDTPEQKIVNAGTYNLTCDSTDLVVKRGSSTTGANGIALVDNYNITGGGASTFTVSPAPLTVSWTNNTLIYNGKAQGQVLAGASSNGKTFTVSNGNIVNAFEGDVITFTLSGQETNAGENYQMTASATSLTNAQRPTSVLGNYTITIPECVYNIQKAPIKVNVVRIDGISGAIVEKVYDATRDVKGTPSVDWSSTNGGVTPKENEYTVTVIYDSADAGERTITYTVTELNNNYVCDVLTGTIAGRITPLQLTVELDRLRGDKATKTFDDSISYGGAGFEGNSAGRSRTYRIGEGFSVSGFPSGGSSIKIVAEFKEAETNREKFDAYINNVVQNGTEFSVDKDANHYKKLVFTMSGEKAGNYTFVVVRGGTTLATSSNGSATVFDKDDTANVGSSKATSNISIEITVAQLKASYGNTAQSYANADNTYNTKWEAVTATSGVSGLDIAVVNGWMTDENGQPKVYDKYTVIRGRENSAQLSASITKDANGKYINYRLSNQPILTIGYFVSGDEFEIGSLASLMIATYYQYAAQHGEDGNFNPVISSIATWIPVVSNADYESGSFDKPSDAGECTSWDEYFAMKETAGINIFLNAYEGNVWGYYESKEESAPTQYKSYKQVANVSGIMTAEDITILDNFFITAEGQKAWGINGDYITNFVKVGVGNVIIATGSLFKETFGTGYSYDGNGYTINHVNIINYADNANVGMFANVNGGEIKNVNLRNFSIVSNGSGNVGGIVATGSNATLENSTFHGSITVNGNANVGGLIGSGNMGVEGAIVLGNIDAIGTANVGGVIGVADGNAINNIVSMIEVYADGNVGAIVGTGSISASSNQVFYLANSAWHRKVGENNPIIANSNYGTSKTYTELFNGSISGYGSTKYYTQDAKFGAYDVVKNIVDIDEAVHAPRESINLRDIVDIYLLMYSLSEYTLNETSGQKAYAISDSSWLVGNKHGTTDANDAIVIANQQGVALLRELRFATFTLANDVEMYSTHGHSVFDGVFYGTIIADGHKIYLQGANAMFEYTVNALPIEQKKA